MLATLSHNSMGMIGRAVCLKSAKTALPAPPVVAWDVEASVVVLVVVATVDEVVSVAAEASVDAEAMRVVTEAHPVVVMALPLLQLLHQIPLPTSPLPVESEAS